MPPKPLMTPLNVPEPPALPRVNLSLAAESATAPEPVRASMVSLFPPSPTFNVPRTFTVDASGIALLLDDQPLPRFKMPPERIYKLPVKVLAVPPPDMPTKSIRHPPPLAIVTSPVPEIPPCPKFTLLPGSRVIFRLIVIAPVNCPLPLVLKVTVPEP